MLIWIVIARHEAISNNDRGEIASTEILAMTHQLKLFYKNENFITF